MSHLELKFGRAYDLRTATEDADGLDAGARSHPSTVLSEPGTVVVDGTDLCPVREIYCKMRLTRALARSQLKIRL